MIRLRKPNYRERVAGGFTLAVVLAAGVYSLFIEPVTLEWTALHRRAHTLEQRLDELRGLSANREIIEREYAAVKQALPRQEAGEDAMLALFSEVDVVARDAGLDVGNVRPLVKRTEGAFDRIGVELSARGDAHSVVKFLQALQTSEHLLNSQALTLTVNRTAPPISITVSISKMCPRAGGG